MEDLEANKTQPPPATVGLWLGYGALCVGMFMAILDIQVVVTSLSVIEDALKIGADRMSWVQTTYLIAEIISIPLTGLLIRIFTIRWLFVGAIFTFTLASIGCAFSFDFNLAHRLPCPAGLCRWRSHSFGVCSHLPVLRKGPEANHCNDNRRIARRACANTRTSHRRLDHGKLHVALAVPDQCGARHRDIGDWHFVPSAESDPHLSLFKTLDWISLVYVAIGLAALLIGLKEAPDQGWLAPQVFRLLRDLCNLCFYWPCAGQVRLFPFLYYVTAILPMAAS